MPVLNDHLSLGREEARARAQQLVVTSMLIDLDLTEGASSFGSTTTITFDAVGGADSFVDFQGEQLLSVTLNGRRVDPSSWSRGRIPLSGLQQHNSLVVEGVMAYSSDGEGLHRHVDPADSQVYLYAMSFLDAAPRWFACFDQPDLKAPYELWVTAPEEWTVLGNGPSEQVALGRWHIRPPQPMSTYFVTVVAGPYASVWSEHDGIPLGFHARASLKDALEREAADLMAVTTDAFDYFHRLFGVRYPFGEYSQAFVPDFNAGAMENPGCVTLRDQYIFPGRATRAERAHRAGTMVHEMAHMWFGDLVSMRWWDDLWLNESFAEYLAHRACEESGDYRLWTEFGIDRKDWGFVADQGPSTHPVAGQSSRDAESALQDFDGISYAKGAAVLKQLVAYLGEDVFFSGLRSYFGRHAYSNAEFDDLISAWTCAGAVGLDDWAASWLRTSGLDTLDLTRSADGVTVFRVPPTGQQVSRTHAVQLGAVDDQGRLLSRTALLLGDEPVTVQVPASAALLIPDLEDESWAKVRFGADGWSSLPEILPLLPDAPARVVIYNSVRDGVRDAELPPAQALDLLCRTIVTEPAEVILTSVLAFAQDQLAGPFSPPNVRGQRRQQVHTAAATVLERAHPGSDRQLAAFRRVILSCDDEQQLRDWLRSDRLPDCIELDAELSWALVARIAVLSGDAALVESTLREKPTGVARTHAARARASLPREDAKAAAWRLLMQPSPISAYELYATAEGFFEPSQTALTEQYVGRYFAEIVETATFRNGWSLGRVASLAFPALSARQQTVDLADRTLASPGLAAPLRRSLLDATDSLRRAVVAQDMSGTAMRRPDVVMQS